MTDIIEKAARDCAKTYHLTDCEESQAELLAEVEWIEWVDIVLSVIRSLRDNTDSPRVCDELTRMLGEEG